MPRRKIGSEQLSSSRTALAAKLAEELQSTQESGQPLIYEQELSPERLRVAVIWDAWEGVPLDERTGVILRAYEIAESAAYRNKIALAAGLTVPEATAAGMLPYQVSTALRQSDPVSFEQVRQAMLDEGASTLMGPNIVQLRFATEAEAEACRQRLIRRLPGSDQVWLVAKEITVQDTAAFHDSVQIERSTTDQ